MDSEEDVGIEEVVVTVLKSVLEDDEGEPQPYHPESIDSWSNDCISLICETLSLADPEGTNNKKFIVHVVFCQSVGTGLHASSGAIWDSIHDTSTIVKYKNESVCAIVSVFCLANPKPPPLEIRANPNN